MIPIQQTIIDPKDGNCFQACLASVLEIGLEDVPHFLRLYGRLNMLSEARQWMAKYYGMTILTVDLTGPKKGVIMRPITHGTIMLVSGASKTFAGENHVVVGRIINDLNEYEMIHDPNPSGQGIDGDPLYYYFLTAVDPGRMLMNTNIVQEKI